MAPGYAGQFGHRTLRKEGQRDHTRLSSRDVAGVRITAKEKIGNTAMRLCQWLAVILAAMLFSPALLAAEKHGPPVGGGILDAGLRGEYFANADLAGEPVFERNDVRVRFDWGELLPIIGSRAENLRDFPHANFSVRWTGQVMARFNEPYTFRVPVAGGEARLWVNGQPVANQPVLLKANVPVDVKLEYRCKTRPAAVELRWSSPSTPEELVDTHSVPCVQVNNYLSAVFADAFRIVNCWDSKLAHEGMKTLGGKPIKVEAMDRDYWPKSDFMTNASMGMKGRYLVRFTGKATLAMGRGTFRVAGREYKGTLPSGTGYDPKTNLTTAELDWPGEEKQNSQLRFSETQREATAPKNSGITGLAIMRPLAPGAERYHVLGTMVNEGYKRFVENYVSVREYGSGGGSWHAWDERTSLFASDQFGRSRMRQGGALEAYILMANETGRDLYLNLGTDPAPEVLKKTALAIKYGTDGHEPYAQPVANPVCPPLNPNLRCYLELGVEVVWNYVCGIDKAYERVWQGKTYEWDIINHDRTLKEIRVDAKGWNRLLALKKVETSKAFREVFGDAAMGDRVRVLLFGQYDRVDMWVPMVTFIDTWFNNGDGKPHVKDPHPVNYHIWGGGGAIYYGSKDSTGTKGVDWVKDGDFETPKVEEGKSVVRPAGTAWTFEGPAGIVNQRPVKNLVATFQLGQPIGAATQGALAGSKFYVGGFWQITDGSPVVGCQFTVAKDIYVYQVGGYSGKTKTGCESSLFDRDGNRLHGDARGNSGAGARPEFEYSSLIFRSSTGMSDPRPIHLKPGTYYLLTPAAANVYGDGTQITAAKGITVDGAVTGVIRRNGHDIGCRDIRLTRPGSFSFGPLDIAFTDEPVVADGVTVGVPPWVKIQKATKGENEFRGETPVQGPQTLFLAAGGRVSQKVHFPEAGACALTYRGAGSANDASAGVSVSLDGKSIKDGKAGGAGAGFQESASEVFEIEAPGDHLITLEATGGKNVAGVFLDRVQVSSVARMFGGPDAANIPDTGDALGETKGNTWDKRVQTQINFARSWGLVPSTYEGGWAVGGDRGRTPFMNYCNFTSPLAAVADERAMDLWTRLGGYEFQHYYAQFPCSGWSAGDVLTMYRAAVYPLVQGVIHYNKRLPILPDANGVIVPGILTPANASGAGNPVGNYQNKSITGELQAADHKLPQWGAKWTPQWITWNLLVSRTAEYRVNVQSTPGAVLRVFLNESQVIAEGKSGGPVTGKVPLTPGMHTIKVRAMVSPDASGTCKINGIELKVWGTRSLKGLLE